MQVLIPPGDTPLAGDEAQKCRQFLDAVALPDEESALVHLDVGRSFYRQRCVAEGASPSESLFAYSLQSPRICMLQGTRRCQGRPADV